MGNSELKVSEVGLGANPSSGEVGGQTTISVIHQALELGINFIDIAD